MNIANFIARKFIKGGGEENLVSRPVVKISIVSIALGVFVMILTLSIVTGFKKQVRDKVIGFGSHVQIMRAGTGNIFEAEPLFFDTNMVTAISEVLGVHHVSPVVYLPGIFQSKGDSVDFSLPDGRDTIRLQQEIKGVMLKGVNDERDLVFFQKNIVEGRSLSFVDTSSAYELLVSRKVAQQMQFSIGAKVPVFFVQDKPIRRNFQIVGIYETGLEDFDSELAIAKKETVQRLSGWGIQSSLRLEDTLHNGRLLFSVSANGGRGAYRHNWGEGYGMISKVAFVPTKDTVLRVITNTYAYSAYEEDNLQGTTIADTTYIKIQVKGDVYSGPPLMEGKNIKKYFLDDAGFKYSIVVGSATLIFEEIHGYGTSNAYVSGYEVLVNDWDQLDFIGDQVRHEMLFYSMENKNPVDILTIKEVYNDIFSWLDFLDINFSIILILMVAISVITMGASLLVLIMEKTAAIGLLKALGARDCTVRKVFLYQAAYLIFRGIFWGNVMGITIALLQQYFNIFPLDPAVYYLNAVPIQINWFYLLLLNFFTILVCLFFLLIPSYFITRIRPTESIKFS